MSTGAGGGECGTQWQLLPYRHSGCPPPTPSARGPGLHVGLRSFWSLRRPEEERHPLPSDSARASGPPGAGFAHAQCGAASERVAGPPSPASCGPRRTHAVPVPLLGRVQTSDPRRAAPAATSPGRRGEDRGPRGVHFVAGPAWGPLGAMPAAEGAVWLSKVPASGQVSGEMGRPGGGRAATWTQRWFGRSLSQSVYFAPLWE